MNTNNIEISFDKLIEQDSHIVYRRDLRKSAENLLVLATGFLVFFLSNKIPSLSNDSQLVLSTLGIGIIGIGILLFINRGHSYRYIPLGSRMTRGTRYFSRSSEAYFTHLKGEEGEDSWPAPVEEKNGGIRVEYIYDSTAGYLLLLPSIYEDLTYRPLRSGLCITGSRARVLGSILKLN